MPEAHKVGLEDLSTRKSAALENYGRMLIIRSARLIFSNLPIRLFSFGKWSSWCYSRSTSRRLTHECSYEATNSSLLSGLAHCVEFSDGSFKQSIARSCNVKVMQKVVSRQCRFFAIVM